jgi:hypothetical protein
MIKVFSKQSNSEILLNEHRVTHITPTFDNHCIVHFDSGSVLSISNSIEDIYNTINQKSSTFLPQEQKNSLPSTENTGKLYPDEFPDDFPRFKSGKICTTSKKYIEYMKAKENAEI